MLGVLMTLALSSASLPSPPPETLVRRFMADFAAENAVAIEKYVGEDAVLSMPFAPEGPQSLSGKAAAMAYFRSVFAKYRSIHLIDAALTPAADGTTVFVEAKADYEAVDGAHHRIGYVWAVTVVDGRIMSSRDYSWPLNAGPAR